MEIISLYEQGMGLKRIARATGLSTAGVRKRLIKEGVYQGLGRELSRTKIGIAAIDGSDGTEGKFPPLETWESKGGAYVKIIDGVGWGVGLPSGFDSWLISPVLEGWSGKGLEFSALLAGVESLIIGIMDEKTVSEINCQFQTGTESRWHVRHPCSSAPRLFFRSNNYKQSGAAVSQITLREISTEGLRPSVLPLKEKKLEAGTRIDLKWQIDGCRTEVVPNALKIIFNSHSSLYSEIPREAWGCRLRLMVGMAGVGDIELALGDNDKSERKTVGVRREAGVWQVEKIVGKGAFVRLSNRGYETNTVFLNDAYCEVIS